MTSYKPNKYNLGSKPELLLTTIGISDESIIPTESRLSIKSPDGVILTVSGADMIVASGYIFYRYTPETKGWYEYEAWVKDGTGREDAATRGFEVTDRVY
jgi:hypothetical protein